MPRKRQNLRRAKQTHGLKNAALDKETKLIYGVMPVLETLRASAGRIRKIVIAEGRQDERTAETAEIAKSKGVPVTRRLKKDIGAMVPDGVNHQGIVAFVKTAEYKSPDYLIEKAGNDPQALLLVLDGIEDPRNLGAILRTAECAGVTGVFVPERRAAGLTDTAVKSSAGASELIDIAKVKNTNRLIEELKSNGIWVVGASGDADQSYIEWDFCQPTALVLGSEGKGLHRLTSEKCDVLVKIPIHGRISSLNVSVAAGVIIFEAARQRTHEKA